MYRISVTIDTIHDDIIEVVETGEFLEEMALKKDLLSNILKTMQERKCSTREISVDILTELNGEYYDHDEFYANIDENLTSLRITSECTKCSTEYAVEINDKNHKFLRQIEVFKSYEEVVNFVDTTEIELNEGEYFNIIFIDYDENGDEIGFGSVV